MNRTELKQLIREAVEEVMNEFAPMGVADEAQQLNEKSPPNFPKKLHDKLLKQYKGEEEKAYATMWKIFYEKEKGHKKINEMWTAWENESINEEGGSEEQNAEHDESDLSNPEEAREVELANKIKALANDLLKMHGVDDESDEIETDSEESDEEGVDSEYSSEEYEGDVTDLQEKWNKKYVVDPIKKGMFKGKTISDLEKELKKLKKKGPYKKGSKEYKKMQELNFAIRAKRHWPKSKK